MNHLNKLRQLIFKRDTAGLYKMPLSTKTALNVEQKREMGTCHGWDGVVRNNKPQNLDKATLEKKYDPITGAELMPDADPSGMNHSLVRNKDFNHPTYSQIYGVLTSSSKRIDGIIPEMIDSHLFTGKATPQFFIRFVKPKLILTASISEDKLVDFSAEHLKEFLMTLDKKDINDD